MTRLGLGATGHGLPPYADVVFAADIRALVGVPAVGMLAFLISRAEPTGTGGWSVRGRVDDLAREAGMARSTFLSHVATLADAGLIAKKKGMRFGPAGGSTPNSYWLTYHPSMIGPTPEPPPPTRESTSWNAETRNAVPWTATTGHADSRPATPRHLVPVSEREMPLETPAGGFPTGHVVDVENTSPPAPAGRPDGGSPTLAAPAALDAVPRFVADPLRAIGWASLVPAGVPLDVLAAVAGHLVRLRETGDPAAKRRPAGFLRHLINAGTLTVYAREQQLLASDPHGTLAAAADTEDTEHLMSLEEFDKLAWDHPAWAHAVRIEAGRQARSNGWDKVPARLVREIASRTPLDADLPQVPRTSAANPF